MSLAPNTAGKSSSEKTSSELTRVLAVRPLPHVVLTEPANQTQQTMADESDEAHPPAPQI